MKRSEKILASALGGVLVLFGGFFVVRSVLLRPVNDLRKQTAITREATSKIHAERRAFFQAEDKLRALALRTFAESIDEASAKSGETVTRTLLDSRLDEGDFTRIPVGPRKLRGAAEIGWAVQGDGSLSNVVNLLFLLNESPWLHRVEGLSFSTGDRPGNVRVRFRFLTLVLDPSPDVTRTNLAGKLSLDSPERHLLNPIVARDLLRPYIKRPPPPPASVAGPGSAGSAPNTPAGRVPGPEALRVVSLSEWDGQPEVHVRDVNAQRTLRYRPGDELAGGTIVLIDYRPLPSPSRPSLLSHSRVILRIGADFWAIERGRSLADKRKLAPSEIPESLARTP
jgi:hypothetical protein